MNTLTSIYQDIAQRTAGDIYIGVVGPARTGKSTFIKRFMETMVIPNIDDEFRRQRARDELPQSGSGRTVMTAEPKFVPEEAVEIAMEGGGRPAGDRAAARGESGDVPVGAVRNIPREDKPQRAESPVKKAVEARRGAEKLQTGMTAAAFRYA